MKNNSAARRQDRRDEAISRNERNAPFLIDCKCGNRHLSFWTGCPLVVLDRPAS